MLFLREAHDGATALGRLDGQARAGARLLRLAGCCGALFALGACSTIVKGTTQDIDVTTTPVTQADCTLSSGDAMYRVTTPGTVEVSRSGRSLNVACTKEGYQEGHATVDSSFNGVTFGNVLVGGVIGIAADAMSGANNSYPEEIIVPLVPLVSESPATGATPSMPAPDGTKEPAAPAEMSSERTALQSRLSANLERLRGRINTYKDKLAVPGSDPAGSSKVREVVSAEVVSLQGNGATVRVDTISRSGRESQQLFDLVLLGDDYSVVRQQEPSAASS